MKRIEWNINACKNCLYFTIFAKEQNLHYKYCNKFEKEIKSEETIPDWCRLPDSDDHKLDKRFCYVCGSEISITEFICENCISKYHE